MKKVIFPLMLAFLLSMSSAVAYAANGGGNGGGNSGNGGGDKGGSGACVNGGDGGGGACVNGGGWGDNNSDDSSNKGGSASASYPKNTKSPFGSTLERACQMLYKSNWYRGICLDEGFSACVLEDCTAFGLHEHDGVYYRCARSLQASGRGVNCYPGTNCYPSANCYPGTNCYPGVSP